MYGTASSWLIRGSPRAGLDRHQIIRTSKISKRRKDDQYKHSPHLTGRTPQKTVKDVAMAYFDDQYGKTFGRSWPSIRLGLHSPTKFCALINNTCDPDTTKQKLLDLGCLSVRDEVVNLLQNQPDDVDEEDKSAVQVPTERPARPTTRTPKIKEEHESELSLPLDQDSANRVITPDQRVLGGRNEAAVLLDYVPATGLRGMEDVVDESEYYDYYRKVDDLGMFEIRPDKNRLSFPQHLHPFVFPSSNLSRFPPPSKGATGTYDYYCFNLASVLPVLALSLRPKDNVLDMCSGPGGKALAVVQTLIPATVVCNDVSPARLKKVKNVMDMYLRDYKDIKDIVSYSRLDGVELHLLYPGGFDKVLCDVPCFTDRNTIHEEENNIFNSSRIQERIKYPELQTELLRSALSCVRPGGSVVYSTCTMSPIQNDGIVKAALKYFWEETSVDFFVSDLSKTFSPLKKFMKFAEGQGKPKYGQLVIPSIIDNFGPMYVAKITRVN